MSGGCNVEPIVKNLDAGNEDLLLQMGLGLVGAVYTNQSEATLDDTTPVARLIEEAEAIVVPGDSPYSTLDELVEAWKADPAGVSVGGGSSPGGPDHLTPMLLAQAVGIEPTQVNYVAYDGGGELLAALLGSQVVFGATGVGEIAEQAKALTVFQRTPNWCAPLHNGKIDAATQALARARSSSSTSSR
jgi:putative tricarboxylic transport membrane protein